MVILEKGDKRVVECSVSNCEYQGTNIGNHWRYYPDHRRQFTDEEMQILTGIMMSDGTINKTSMSRNPQFKINSFTTPRYLEYLDSLFDVMSVGVRPHMTAARSARNNRESGFRPNAEPKNYSDKFYWGTRSHPQLEEFVDWYQGDDQDKVWPGDITLSSTILKHLYCCDGSWNNSDTNNSIRISISNEGNNQDKVTSLFVDSGLPKPKYSEVTQRDGSIKVDAYFSIPESKTLWEYMGPPCPGFEYKWPERYRKD